ncbi:MAG: hypothetical protein EA394_01560 [Bacteroidia bacterium]|nr:MAG: hypothetical protein EA394_01560 [Bacteroidia bacterium]
MQSNESLLKDYVGWLVHECCASYFKLHNLKHAICGVHILRELQALADSGDKQSCRKRCKTFNCFRLIKL